jgi:hypothetical protein
MYRLIFIVIAALVLPYAIAGEADIVDARAVCDKHLVCDFEVTVLHADEGWDHYANRWEVLTPDGDLLATRELAHPHENEQPFTRSLRGVRIPGGLDRVLIRANDSVHGYGGKTILLTLDVN